MDATQFRNLVKQISGTEISSEQAGHFLEIFKEELEQDLVNTRRLFIEKHFGNRNTNQ
jgi:hypothetical protein